MKKIIIALITVSIVLPAFPSTTQKVCIITKDKTGKKVQKCRMMKVHKKLESATKVPTKKSKK